MYSALNHLTISTWDYWDHTSSDSHNNVSEAAKIILLAEVFYFKVELP